MVRDPLFGDPPVDRSAESDADEQVGPDLAEDGADFFAAHCDAVVPSQPFCGVDDLAVEPGFEHERFHPTLEAHLAEHDSPTTTAMVMPPAM